MGILIDFYTRKRIITAKEAEDYSTKLYGIIAFEQPAMFENKRKHSENLYVLDSEDKWHWVYAFATKKKAEAFMNLYNTEKYRYIITQETV